MPVNSLMIKLNLRKKVLITTSLLIIGILGATDILWIKMVEPILDNRLEESQKQIGLRAAEKVKSYMDAKVRALIIHSQSAAFLTQNQELERVELFALFSQDQDIDKISLINTLGKEQVAITKQGDVAPEQLEDKNQSESFIFTTFRYGKEYISDVNFINSKPTVTVAIPITIPETRQRLTDLTTAGIDIIRNPGDILGVLEVEIDLNNLFEELTSLGTEQSGFLYVVDGDGSVIAHRDKKFIIGHSNFKQFLPVSQYINSIQKESTTSQTSGIVTYTDEYNQQVLGTFVSVPRTTWAVIIQQSRSIALADFTRVTTFAILLLLVGLGITGPTIYILTRKFTDPISTLVQAADALGQGNFEYRVNIHSRDEIETLALAFNTMATRLGESRKRLEKDKTIISGERNKLSIILSGISDAVIAVDHNRKIILFNAVAEEITGYSSEEVLDKPIGSIINLYDEATIIPSEIYCPISLDKFEGVLWSKKNIKLKSTKTEERFINLVAGQIKEGQEIGIGCIITIHDVSKERQLEGMKLDFISMAAHELRTPLTVIRGYTSLLAKNNKDVENAEIIKRLESGSENLSILIDNLLNVSKIEKGQLSIDVTPYRLKILVQEVLAMLSGRFKIKGQSLQTIGLEENYPLILLDPLRIREVLTNILSNAINYTQEKGMIIVTLARKQEKGGKYLQVSVRDNGYGIPKDAIPNLFTKFFRVHGSLEMGSKGTGLGLFISKTIIDLHGGKIWAVSELGKGSTFTFTLPVTKEEIIKRYHEQSQKQDLPARKHGVILNPDRI